MKTVYLRIEHCRDDKIVFSEAHEAKIDKDYLYFGKYKLKKADTELIPHTEKSKIIPGKDNRLIKVGAGLIQKDSRFILVNT